MNPSPGRRSLVQPIAALASANGFAAVLSIALAPVYTRLYSTDAIGASGLFNSYVSLALPVAALAYPSAIVMARTPGHARSLFGLSLVLAVPISAAVGAAVYFLQPASLRASLNDQSALFSLVVSLSLFLGVLSTVLQNWLVRRSAMTGLSRATVGASAVAQLTRVGLGLFRPDAWSAVAASLLGAMASPLLFGRQVAREHPAPGEFRLPGAADLRSVAFEYRDFAIFRTPMLVLSSFSVTIPVFALGTLGGLATAGAFTVARSLVSLPLDALAQAMYTVYSARFADAVREGAAIGPLIRAETRSLVVPALVVSVLGFVLSPIVTTFALGEAWSQSGELARWLALWGGIAILNRPAAAAVPLLGLQGFHLAYEAFCVVIRASALLIPLLAFNDATLAVALLSLAGGLLSFPLVFYVFRESARRDLDGRAG